jgi:hypothetical protein
LIFDFNFMLVLHSRKMSELRSRILVEPACDENSSKWGIAERDEWATLGERAHCDVPR